MKALLTNISALVLSYYTKFKLIGRSVFEFESRNQNVDGQMHEQIWSGTDWHQSQKNSLVVSCHPVKFQIDGEESGNQNVDRQIYRKMDAPTGTNFKSDLAQVVLYYSVQFQTGMSIHRYKDRWTHQQIQFQKKPSPGGVLSPCQVSN